PKATTRGSSAFSPSRTSLRAWFGWFTRVFRRPLVPGRNDVRPLKVPRRIIRFPPGAGRVRQSAGESANSGGQPVSAFGPPVSAFRCPSYESATPPLTLGPLTHGRRWTPLTAVLTPSFR